MNTTTTTSDLCFLYALIAEEHGYVVQVLFYITMFLFVCSFALIHELASGVNSLSKDVRNELCELRDEINQMKSDAKHNHIAKQYDQINQKKK